MREADDVGDLGPADLAARSGTSRPSCAPKTTANDSMVATRPGSAARDALEQLGARRHALAQRAHRRVDERVAIGAGPLEVARARRLGRQRREVRRSKSGRSGDAGERVVVGVDAHALVAEADDQPLAARASGPPRRGTARSW